jgi:pimeloyl-ACP methyl ester carboxylesterase
MSQRSEPRCETVPTLPTAPPHSGEQPSAPPLPLYLSDPGRAAIEFGLLLGTLPFSRALPTGDGHPVLVLPGLMAADDSTWPLRRILRRLGYRVHGWRLGRNVGPTSAAVNGMRDRLHDLHTRYDAPVSVIGWSLGGIYARGLARNFPSAVRQVITLGSPFRLTNDSQSHASRMFNRYTHLHTHRARTPLQLERDPLTVPATSIYSRYDGIVAWQACLDLSSPRAENIAVVGSHFGYGHHPAVIFAVADRLAQPLNEWEPFQPPRALRRLFPRPAAQPCSIPAAAAAEI